METMIACCGLNCTTCPVHMATLEPDNSRQKSLRESIAELCSQQYGMNLQPEEITDCDGCLASTGRLFFGCRNCEIRKCVLLKNIKSCAFCSDYTCEMLLNHFLSNPESQIRIEEIRQNME